MVLIAHLSDCHLGPLPRVRVRDLASKRAFGFLNWQRNRRHGFDDRVLGALVADMKAAAPDHIAVTGDLVNLGLDDEIAAAREWLKTLGAPRDVTVVPGNHDAYVKGAFEAACRSWHDHMTGDESDGPVVFPFVRRRGALAVIGLSTAVPTAPLMATGRLGHDQIAALAPILADLGREGLFRVVLIHHPPVAHSRHGYRRLIDAARFRDTIGRAGAELVLHGHDHKPRFAEIDGPRTKVPVVGVRATSAAPSAHHPGGGYNLYEIEGGPEACRITMRHRAVRHPGGPVETISEHVIGG